MIDTLMRLARIMHRLRLRSPATEAEKREWAAIRQAAGEAVERRPYTITEADVGHRTIRAFGQVRLLEDFLGRVQPGDVGKRVYQRGGVLQVENEEQRAARCDGQGTHRMIDRARIAAVAASKRTDKGQRGLLPYSVGLAGVSGSLMGRFETEQEAAEFIATLPDHEDGRYYLDGPPDEGDQ